MLQTLRCVDSISRHDLLFPSCRINVITIRTRNSFSYQKPLPSLAVVGETCVHICIAQNPCMHFSSSSDDCCRRCSGHHGINNYVLLFMLWHFYTLLTVYGIITALYNTCLPDCIFWFTFRSLGLMAQQWSPNDADCYSALLCRAFLMRMLDSLLCFQMSLPARSLEFQPW